MRFAWSLAAALLLLTWPSAAQVQFGELSSHLSGTVSPGYTASYGNMTSSTHGWTLGGAATLSGALHSPNFFSYDASLYANQSRANSNFQSISNATGVDVTANIFGGSHFPGAVSYTKAYNSEGNYAVPGLANYVTHGNSDSFGISWSESVPDVPSFSAGFQLGNSHYSVYGTKDQGTNAFHSVNLHSGYTYAGFNMGAYYSKGGGHSLIPQVVAGQLTPETHNDGSAYGFNVNHRLPLRGSFATSINRSNWNTDYLGSSSSGTVDTINSLAAVHPTNKFSLSVSADYSDNLSGQLYQSIIAAGGVPIGVNLSESSNSLDLMGTASYSPGGNIQTQAFAERRSQTFRGKTYGVQSYGGSAMYARRIFAGSFNGAVTVSANTADNSGTDTLGFSTNENYSNEFFGWHVNGSFGYAQNVQTLLVTYMNSYFNYSGSARRRWGKFSVSAGAGAARTGLTQQAGTENSSESYNASTGYGSWVTATGSYSRSNGQALATGAGLVPVPVPSPIVPSNLVSLFGGDSYSFGLSSSPAKRLTLAAAYSKSISNTTNAAFSSANKNNEFNVLTQYQFRKMNFISGYSRLEQGFSGTNSQPQTISSFYIGVSRWFNFF